MSHSFRDRPRLSDRMRGKSGDELFKELRKELDKDRKTFFDSPSSNWGSSTGSAFPRTARLFEEPLRNVDLRSHFEDLANRHPEFADQLNFPAWGNENRSNSWGRKRRGSGNSDSAESSKQQQQEHQQQEQPETADEPGPLRGRPKENLRNTVPDMGQKHQQETEDKESRGQRSWSAPPDNRTQQPEKPRFVSKIEIHPVNPDALQPGDATKPPMAPPKPQPQPQPHQQQAPPHPQPKQSNVRHIPIFVEGRDEPVLPKNIEPEFTQSQAPTQQHFSRPQPQQQHPSSQHQYQPQTPPQYEQPQAQWYEQPPSHQYTQPPQQHQYAQPPHQYTQPPQHQYAQPPQQHHYAQPPQQHQYAQQPQQHQYAQPPQQHQYVPPQPPPPPHQPEQQQPEPPPVNPRDPLYKVGCVQKEIDELKERVENFSGASRTDKDYILLDELLTRNLIKLDDIETEGKEEVRAARKNTIKSIQRCISVLENKVPLPGSEKEMEVEQQTPESGTNETSEGQPGVAVSDGQQEVVMEQGAADSQGSKDTNVPSANQVPSTESSSEVNKEINEASDKTA